MSKQHRSSASKYTDAFKQQLVAESRSNGVTVPMVAKKHGVPTNRIYSWRGDPRYQATKTVTADFTPIEVADTGEPFNAVEAALPEPRIVITLENGRKLSISEGVNAGFILQIARGLAS